MSQRKGTRTALIDGDIIAFKSAAVADRDNLDPDELRSLVSRFFNEWFESSQCSEVLITLSGETKCFRYTLFPEYKANRKDKFRPEMLADARRFLSQMGKTIIEEGLEADDVMGLLATGGRIENPVIVSIDKDMLQIPGWHFNPDKDDFPHRVTVEEGLYRLREQWLTGDSTDGIPGLKIAPEVKRFGPKAAEKVLGHPILDSFDADTRIRELFVEKGATPEQCETQLNLVRILTWDDWDPKEKTPTCMKNQTVTEQAEEGA